MACFHPITAWQPAEGGVLVFYERNNHRELTIPCGRCKGCRLAKARSWAIRCVHESKMHAENHFSTVTYDDEHHTRSLHYRDVQLWLKRLRKARGPFRYFICGEYGTRTQRPHYHALLFGLHLHDRKQYSETLWTSEQLNRTWGKGNILSGQLTYQSAAYCAKYILKKQNGEHAKTHYTKIDVNTGEIYTIEPEMAHMSLNPGIGRTWFDKYWKQVYRGRDAVIIGGKTLPPPTFYNKLLSEHQPDIWDEIQYDRYTKSEEFMKDCTPERLLAREAVATARENLNKRRYG